MAKIQIYSLFTEEYGKNLSPKYQYNPNPRFYTPLYKLLTYNHRAMHPRLFSLYETVLQRSNLSFISFTQIHIIDIQQICCGFVAPIPISHHTNIHAPPMDNSFMAPYISTFIIG